MNSIQTTIAPTQIIGGKTECAFCLSNIRMSDQPSSTLSPIQLSAFFKRVQSAVAISDKNLFSKACDALRIKNNIRYSPRLWLSVWIPQTMSGEETSICVYVSMEFCLYQHVNLQLQLLNHRASGICLLCRSTDWQQKYTLSVKQSTFSWYYVKDFVHKHRIRKRYAASSVMGGAGEWGTRSLAWLSILLMASGSWSHSHSMFLL